GEQPTSPGADPLATEPPTSPGAELLATEPPSSAGSGLQAAEPSTSLGTYPEALPLAVPRTLAAVPSPPVQGAEASPGAAQVVPSATVVSIPQSSRRFLEPLVGVDPATVRVLQAPTGAAETRGADALTLGDDIVLAAGQAGDSPQALGLLAHELSHVALARGEGNVTPPIAQDPSTPDRPGESLDEESLARRGEARVISAAETLAGPRSSSAPTSNGPLQLTPKHYAPAGPVPVL